MACPKAGKVRCDGHHSRAQGEQGSIEEELQSLGGRVGLFVEWADCIETEGGTLGEQRLGYEEDFNRDELKNNNELATIPWWERDETEDAERVLRILRDGTRRLILRLLHMQSVAPPKRVRRIKRPARREAEMSGCFRPTHPAPSPITWSAEGWRWRRAAAES